MIQDKIEALKAKHRDLEEKIKIGYTLYLDDPSLYKMKQEKLHIKEAIMKEYAVHFSLAYISLIFD